MAQVSSTNNVVSSTPTSIPSTKTQGTGPGMGRICSTTIPANLESEVARLKTLIARLATLLSEQQRKTASTGLEEQQKSTFIAKLKEKIKEAKTKLESAEIEILRGNLNKARSDFNAGSSPARFNAMTLLELQLQKAELQKEVKDKHSEIEKMKEKIEGYKKINAANELELTTLKELQKTLNTNLSAVNSQQQGAQRPNANEFVAYRNEAQRISEKIQVVNDKITALEKEITTQTKKQKVPRENWERDIHDYTQEINIAEAKIKQLDKEIDITEKAVARPQKITAALQQIQLEEDASPSSRLTLPESPSRATTAPLPDTESSSPSGRTSPQSPASESSTPELPLSEEEENALRKEMGLGPKSPELF